MILGATEEEIDVAVATVSQALAHPVLRMAAASAELEDCAVKSPYCLERTAEPLSKG
jgi:hypothetical protein